MTTIVEQTNEQTTDERTNEPTTDTVPDTVSYRISKIQGQQLSALHYVAAGKSSGRQLLESVNIRYTSTPTDTEVDPYAPIDDNATDSFLRFTVTDSYRMVERVYTVVDDKESNDTEVYATVVGGSGDEVSGTVNVNALALRDAIKSIKSQTILSLEVGPRGATLTGNGVTVELPAVDGQYPNVDKLWADSPPNDDMSGIKHVAISARYLYDIERSTGRVASRMGPSIITGSADLKPFHVSMPGESNWRAVLMPVRI